MVDKKPKGVKTAYACFIQVIREEHKKQHPEESINFSEFSKKCSERWRDMNVDEKKRFKDISDKDKERHNKEMEGYTPPAGTKKKRKAKNPDEPKRAWSAFFFFSDEHRKSIREEHPEFKVGDISKQLGKMWEVQADKSKYEAQAKKDKERYVIELADFKNGVSKPKIVKSEGDHVNGNADEEEEEEEEEDVEDDE